MTDSKLQFSDSAVDVVLEGGPSDIAASSRVRRVSRTDDKIKIMRNGGYEHFERIEDSPGREGRPVVFRWTGRTAIAE